MKLILFQPEIAPNAGACIRNCACFGAELHIIEPCGFPLKARDLTRAAMDYRALAEPELHASWEEFCQSDLRRSGRLVLLSTKAEMPVHDFAFGENDMLLLGQESAGVPENVREACDGALRIPLAPGARSLNMATAGAIALSEARRQLWPART